ncbi:hypothetical protein CEXT_391831, partial [Caerostris extrusa]
SVKAGYGMLQSIRTNGNHSIFFLVTPSGNPCGNRIPSDEGVPWLPDFLHNPRKWKISDGNPE